VRPPATFSQAGVTLTDRFGTSAVDLPKVATVCAPADKNGEDPSAPEDPTHLVGYAIASRGFARRTAQAVHDQFGDHLLDVVKPARLLVPTAKSLDGPPSSPVGALVDHFQCYRVRGRRGGRIAGVQVDDQFGAHVVDLLKPLRL